MKKRFENAEVGDKVVDIVFGEGEVIGLDDDAEFYTLLARFPHIAGSHSESYSLEGFGCGDDLFPRLYYLEGYTPATCGEPKRRPNFQHDEVILVRQKKHQDWTPRHFKAWGEGTALCYSEGKSSKTVENPCSQMPWRFYKPYEEQ